VLLAMLSDALMSSVVSTRQAYLVEFGKYIEGHGLSERPATRQPEV
jgi:hypothetical protein